MNTWVKVTSQKTTVPGQSAADLMILGSVV